ncbi:hypothetical protein [Nocardioides humi]|uniref:SnoaL-like domain-containing protein n=1 Tax=Nocardioides humi TaxID=449461 RepID=A0ABN1ZXR1_9ACTN|nr:hypothetical protein [Nocardioides humi]
MAATPEARIEAFLADYFAQWEVVAPLFEQQAVDGFDRWLPALAEVEQRHLAPGTDFRIENSFARPATFRPGGEEVARVETDGDAGRVRTVVDDVLESVREYELVRVGGDWLIGWTRLRRSGPARWSSTAGRARSRCAAPARWSRTAAC